MLTETQIKGNRTHTVLRVSFWIKLVFVVVEILLAIAFVACTFTKHYNPGAVIEWVIAFIFSAYVFSFYVDLWPAVFTKGQGYRYRPGAPHQKQLATREMEEGASDRHLNAASGTHPHNGRFSRAGHNF